jgi:hypothetical protein
MNDVVCTLGKSYAWEPMERPKNAGNELGDLEKGVGSKMGKEWTEILKLAGVGKDQEGYERRKRALVLLYTHFLRLDIVGSSLQRGSFSRSMLGWRSKLNLFVGFEQNKITSFSKHPNFSTPS